MGQIYHFLNRQPAAQNTTSLQRNNAVYWHRQVKMTEVELKARVTDREQTAYKLDSFARRVRHVIRDDDYWGKSADDRNKIRIRRELFLNKDGSACRNDILVTYKRKAVVTGSDGVAIEANDEKECSISDAAALEAFLQDTGYHVQLKKHKDVEDWELELPKDSCPAQPLTATLELCAVPPLGDFLEIEILSPSADKDSLAKLHAELERLLALAGIPKEQIEPRTYSEMLSGIPS